jgi:hypothetical protein
MNNTKYQLKLMKDVIGTNSGAFGKTGAGTSEPESSAFLIFFEFFENTQPGIAGEMYVQLFDSFPGKKIHLNRSSERKVMPVLRRTLRIRFCGGGN